ncbi:MAG: LysR family transcriptional regulator [Sphingomonadales bacterium]
MDISFLQTLLSVERYGSIAAAARVQGLTSAAVSQRIKTLEEQLKTPLFKRSGKTVKPSEGCLRILPAVRKIVEEVSALPSLVSADGLNCTLRIGAIGTMMSGLIPQSLAKLRVAAPGVLPEIHPGTSPALYEALMKGELDMALLIAPPFDLPKHLKATHIRREKLNLLSSLEDKGDFETLFRSRPYIQYNPQSWGGRQAEKFLHDQGIMPDIFCMIDALSTTANMVAQGLGISLVPDWLRDSDDSYDVRWTVIEDDIYARDIILLQQHMSAKSSAIEAFKTAAGISGKL